MANQIFENTFLVSSFHAVNDETGEEIAADENGYITAKAGDRIAFECPYDKHDANLNTITFFTKGNGLKVQINDNEQYPIYVEPNCYKSIQYIRIHSITVQSDCTFYYEGLCSE